MPQALAAHFVQRFRIPRVGIPHHAQRRVIGQRQRDALVGLAGAVGDHGDAGASHVTGIAATAGMDGHEIGLRGTHRHGVEQRPVGDGVRAVAHALGHDVGMRHRPGIQMIAGKGNRPRQHALADHVVDGDRERRAFAVAEPGDPRRQAFERNVLARQRDPVGQDVIVGKRLQQMVVDLADVITVVGQRNPAERADGAGEQRPQIGLGEDLDIEGIRHAALTGLGADEVAVVEHHGAGPLEAEHGADMAHDGVAAFLHERLGIVFTHAPDVREAAARRHITVNQVVRRGLVGDHVGNDAAVEQRLVDVSSIAVEADRGCVSFAPVSYTHLDVYKRQG